jgi:hypothetical protein
VLQAMLGTAQAEPRPRPGMAPERVALIKDRIAELKAGITKGGVREAALRSLLYVGMAEPGVDERAFNTLREMRRENDGVTLEAFKQMVREQYFSLVLDPEGAVAAIPGMLPADAGKRARILAAVRRTASADGEMGDKQAERLEQLEKLFQPQTRRVAAKKAPRKAVRRLKS